MHVDKEQIKIKEKNGFSFTMRELHVFMNKGDVKLKQIEEDVNKEYSWGTATSMTNNKH